MTKYLQYTTILLAFLLISCKNDTLKKTKSQQIHIAIILNGDTIVPFWNAFQKSKSIQIIPHYYTLEEFVKKADSLQYNLDVDVIWMPTISTLKKIVANNLLQPINDIQTSNKEKTTFEPNKWFVIGYDPYIVKNENAVNSYSDLKNGGTWNSSLTKTQEDYFYTFAQLHFNSPEKFEKWKQEMESGKTTIKSNDTVVSINKTLSLHSIEAKKGNSIVNQQGVALFYDITAVGIYKHCKNYSSSTSFLNWMLQENQLKTIAAKNYLVSPFFDNNNTDQIYKFHRIRPNYIVQQLK